jgi:serine/threonine protein phosphatase PrpC
MRCGACGLEQVEGNRFCEDCGASLAPAAGAGRAAGAACPECGAGAETADADGFCSRCGHERPAPERDRIEISLGPHLAGVSDRGKHHPRNEDFFALAADAHGDVLVVCDGVSSSQSPDVAAATAATTASAALDEALRSGGLSAPAAVAAALRAADSALAALPRPWGNGQDPPETTIVLALRQQRALTVGWVGDSRAYLAGPGGGCLLTEDHSWVNEVVAAGLMTRARAVRAPQAHCVTRTLGGPVPGDEPALANFDLPDGSGYLILCSDGLWNEVPEPDTLAALVRAQPAGIDALGVARALVAYALGRSGRDNITAAVLALGAGRRAPRW